MRYLAALALAVGAAPSLPAQSDGPWPWEAESPWHAAVSWADAPDAPHTPGQLLAAAAAELSIGRPGRALELLAAVPDDPATRPVVMALRGAAHEAEERWEEAASLYAGSADRVGGHTRGILAARAGTAFEMSGLPDRAFVEYQRAATMLPAGAGWLRLRAAAVAPSRAAADRLLTGVPPAAAQLALLVRGAVAARFGDSATAVEQYAAGGDYAQAATLALALGDSLVARTMAYRGLRDEQAVTRRASWDVIDSVLPPRHPEELLALARAASSLGEHRQAARFGERAAGLGDTTASTARAIGGWLEDARDRRGALVWYAKAGVDGEYLRARTLVRLGRRSEAARLFLAFTDAHPGHRWAPAALFLAADVLASDSLFRVIAARWPRDGNASVARSRLTARALRRGDTVAALAALADEVAAGGNNANLARFHLARLRLAMGEREIAHAVFSALARDDSIGYYGTIARQVAGLPPARFSPAPPRHPAPSVQQTLAELDALDAAGFVNEAALLVRGVMEEEGRDTDQLLDLSEGLSARGRGPEGIRLAWRAATVRSLQDARVVRAIFPWPARALIEREATKFGLDPFLLAGLIRQESSFAAGARSRAGARGFMQLMPATARWLAGRLGVPWNETMATVPDANVHLGAAHLAGLLQQFDGNVVAALAAYNAGGTPVRRWTRARGDADPIAFVERIPYVETRGYVQSVLRNRALYHALYAPRD